MGQRRRVVVLSWVVAAAVGFLVIPRTSVQAATRPIVFAASETAGSHADGIWRVERDGSGLRRLTEGAIDDEPVLSPDGTEIVFRSDRDGGGLFAVGVDGGAIRRLTSHPEDHTPTWEPNGQRVFFVRNFETENATPMFVPAAGGEATPFNDTANVFEYGLDFTADGTAVGHVHVDDQGGSSIRLLGLNGSTREIALRWDPTIGAPLDFAPNGAWVAASLFDGCITASVCLYKPSLIDLATGEAFEMPTVSQPGMWVDLAVSQDSRELVSYDYDPDTRSFFLYAAELNAPAYEAITAPRFRFIGGIDWGSFGTAEGDPPPVPPGPSADTDRLQGDSRFATAAAIGQAAFPDGAAVAYLARADVVVDAVAGGALTDGPILLVESCGPVPAATGVALQQLAPTTVVALGGESAVCAATLAEAASTAGAGATDRLEGASRFGTAAAIARHAFPTGADVVHLARADLVVDAVAGGVLTTGPVLLVPSCGDVPPVVERALRDLAPRRVVALGGTGAICSAVLDEAVGAAGAASRDRYAGNSRYGTAVEIARAAFTGPGVDRVYLARADVFVDAVAGGVLTDGPILLVPRCDALPHVVSDALAGFAPSRVTALGGPAAVCDTVLTAAGRAAAG